MIVYIWTGTEISRHRALLPSFILNQLWRWAEGDSVVCFGTGEAKALRSEADGTEKRVFMFPAALALPRCVGGPLNLPGRHCPGRTWTGCLRGH